MHDTARRHGPASPQPLCFCCGEPSWAPYPEAPLVSPSQNISQMSLPRKSLDTLQPSVNMTGKLPKYWKKYKIQYWKNSSLAIMPEAVKVDAYLAIVLDRRRSLHGNIFHVIFNIIWGWNPFLAPSSDALFPLGRKVISFIFKHFLDVARASRRSIH